MQRWVIKSSIRSSRITDGRCVAGGQNALLLGKLGLVPTLHEPDGIGLEGDPVTDDLGALGPVVEALHLHGQREPVEQLRAQIAFFGVHRADQDQLGRM